MTSNPSMDPATGRRKNTSFKITNILPTSRQSSHLDPEESEDDNESAHATDLENIYNQIIAKTSPVARGRFNVLPDEATTSTSMTATAGVLSYLPNPNRHRDSVDYPLHGPKDRFKVVKIESSIPILRGRWSVVDYSDKEKPQQPQVLMPSVAPNDTEPIQIDDRSRSVPSNMQNIGMTQKETVPNVTVSTNHTFQGPQVAHHPLPQPHQQLHQQPPSFSQPQMTPQPQIVAVSAAASAPQQFVVPVDVHQQQHPPRPQGKPLMTSTTGSQTGGPVMVPTNGSTPPLVAPKAILGQVQVTRDFVDEELVERLEEISIQQGAPDEAEDPDGASGSSQGAIDNRIEQAMDLVKSHLMNAVRSEVDELKEKIIKQEEIIAQNTIQIQREYEELSAIIARLQAENEFLKKHVAPEVLLQLANLHKQEQ